MTETPTPEPQTETPAPSEPPPSEPPSEPPPSATDSPSVSDSPTPAETVTETVTETAEPVPVEACGLNSDSACYVRPLEGTLDPLYVAFALSLLLLAALLVAQLRRPS